MYYISSFVDDRFDNFAEVLNKIDKNKILLVFDSNICIYLSDFFESPNEFINRLPAVWNELEHLLLQIKKHDLYVNVSLGIDESCRNKSNFDLIPDKLQERLFHVEQVLFMSPEEILKFRHSSHTIIPIKDQTIKKTTKITSFDKESSFKNLLEISYASMLKAYLLYCETKDSSKTNYQALLDYFEFLNSTLDVWGVNSHFGVLFFGENINVRKMLLKSSKTVEDLLHNIWNASIDLIFPTLVNFHFKTDTFIPVLVTQDKDLATFSQSMKLKMAFTTDGLHLSRNRQIFTGICLNTNWKDPQKITELYNIYTLKRIEKNKEIDIATKMKTIYSLCKELETLVINSYSR